jgi:hypothetical protein
MKDMARSAHVLAPVTIDSLKLTAADIEPFCNRPLAIGAIAEHLVELKTKTEGILKALAFEIPWTGLSPAERSLVNQLQRDLRQDYQSKQSELVPTIKYISEADIEVLHDAYDADRNSTPAKEKAANILAFALKELARLKIALDQLREEESDIIRKGRQTLETKANTGTSQLLHFESIRLKFEFLIYAFLAKDFDLHSVNSHLRLGDDSSQIFSAMSGLLLRSIRLSQIKFCVSQIDRLEGSVKALISTQLLARFKASALGEKNVAAAKNDYENNDSNHTAPTSVMIRFVLGKTGHREADAWAELEKLLQFQLRAATLLVRCHLLPAGCRTVYDPAGTKASCLMTSQPLSRSDSGGVCRSGLPCPASTLQA